MPKHPLAANATPYEKIEQERKDRIIAKRNHFCALFAEWLTNRGDGIRTDIAKTDQGEHEHSEREDELARLITTTPAVYPWMIFRKLEVLEHYLSTAGGTSWVDNREIMMLAGIKADLLRFEPSDGEAGDA